MRIYILLSLLFATSLAQTVCDCVKQWEFKGQTYSGCDATAPKDKEPWCYVASDGCPEAKQSTVKSGEYWRYCTPGEESGDTQGQADENADMGSATVTHMVVVSKAGEQSSDTASDLNPNEPPPSVDDAAVPALKTDEEDDIKPLDKTMSEGKLLRKLWAEMNQVEALIHAANVDLKARLIKAFKVVRVQMVAWEKMNDNGDGKKTEGQRLRGMWAAMGAIEDEIHEINVAMKKRLGGLIKALQAKMHIFDAAADRIDRMRAAEGKPAGIMAGSAADAANAKPVKNGGQGSVEPESAGENPCPPGEVAVAGEDGAVGCSLTRNPNEAQVANVPQWRRHLFEDGLSEMEEMGPLVKTVSEGAKLRALWGELGGIEKEIHETNLVLKERLLKAFKVIRSRMANWEKEGNPDTKKSEGARLRAQWAELGHVEEQIHVTNQEMKRRLRRVIRVIKTKMKHFEKGSDDAKKLANAKNPNKPGRSGKKVPALGGY